MIFIYIEVVSVFSGFWFIMLIVVINYFFDDIKIMFFFYYLLCKLIYVLNIFWRMIVFEMKYENREFFNFKNVSNINVYIYFEGFGYKI